MKVILLKEVKGMGRAHAEVMAADGYALNYLIPKKFAILATPSAMKEAELPPQHTPQPPPLSPFPPAPSPSPTRRKTNFTGRIISKKVADVI